MALLEFVVLGTPVSSQGTAGNRKFWQQRVHREGEAAATGHVSTASEVALRIAYFYVNEPIGDLDNIVKPVQDALKGIAYADDKQVVDLVASMRPKDFGKNIAMTAALAHAFDGGSDFIYVVVDKSSRMEALQ